jgi:hypothetical protein
MRPGIFAGLAAISLTAAAAASNDSMPVAQQNAMVQTYCAVCHTDASMNGGLSLQHFDAANADPGLAAMLVSKLNGGAFGASGRPLPDRATQNALRNALTAEAQGAGEWTFRRAQSGSNVPVMTASVVKEVPAAGEPDLYRLTVTCREDTHEAEMRLAWSPGVPETGRAMAVTVDGNQSVTYNVEGSEKMGNGQAGGSGPGDTSLFRSPASVLPERSLVVSGLFGDEKVVFPFSELNPAIRQTLSACMAKSQTGE